MRINIRTKFVCLISGLAVVFLVLVLFIYRDVVKMIDMSRETYTMITPLTESIYRAERALHKGLVVVDEIFPNVDEPREYDEIRKYHGAFQQTLLEFDMFIKAIIWGSESDTFQSVAGGLTHAQWQRSGLAGKLLVRRAPASIRQLAGKADLYYAGFSQSVQEVLKDYKKALRLRMKGSSEAADGSFEGIRAHWVQAKYYVDLIEEVFDDINRKAGLYAQDSFGRLKSIQQRYLVRTGILLSAFLGLLMLVSFVFMDKTVLHPVRQLMEGTRQVSEGNLGVKLPVRSRDEIGRLAAAFNTMNDQLQKTTVSKDYIETILNSAMDALFITDLEGVIEYVNYSFERMTGFTGTEAVGKKANILKSGRQDQMYYRRLWETIQRGEVFRGEIVNKRKDGSLFAVDEVISFIRNSSGEIIKYVGVMHDITQRKQAEEERQRTLKDLQVFKKIVVDRELKMIELKKQINAMARELGREEPPYD